MFPGPLTGRNEANRRRRFTLMDPLLFIGLPYVAVAVALTGGIQRWRRHRFSYSSVSSQFLESTQLRWGSTPWHLGLLVVLFGHAVAILFPGAWARWMEAMPILVATEAVGMAATGLGLLGLLILILRRLFSARLRAVTSPMDWVLLVLLLVQVPLGGLTAGVHRWGAVWATGTVIPYFWSLVMLRPDLSYVANLPILVKVHLTGAWLVLLVLPYSRLVHILTPPLNYLVRPPQVVVWNLDRRPVNSDEGKGR